MNEKHFIIFYSFLNPILKSEGLIFCTFCESTGTNTSYISVTIRFEQTLYSFQDKDYERFVAVKEMKINAQDVEATEKEIKGVYIGFFCCLCVKVCLVLVFLLLIKEGEKERKKERNRERKKREGRKETIFLKIFSNKASQPLQATRLF